MRASAWPHHRADERRCRATQTSGHAQKVILREHTRPRLGPDFCRSRMLGEAEVMRR